MGWQDQPIAETKWQAAPKVSDKTPNGRTLPDGYTYLGSTDAGGDIFRTPKGDLGYVDANVSLSGDDNQDRIKALLDGADAGKQSRDTFDAQAIDAAPLAARGAKFIQGVPFVGEYADEAIGMAFGDKARGAVRALEGAMDRQRPKESMALQIGGGIAGSIPAVMAAAPAVAAAAPPSLFGKAVAGLVGGAVAGGVEGAVSGYGAGNDGDRAKSAMVRGAIGAVIGGVAGGAVPAMSAAAKSALNTIKGTDVTGIANALGISRKAAEVLKGDLEALDFVAARENLRRAGADAMLADAGQTTREALDATITGGGKAARIGVDAVAKRSAAAGKKLEGVLAAILGVPGGIKAAARSISERTAPVRKKAYDVAYATAIDYASDAGRNIEAVLARVPVTTLKSAISEANDAMRAAGVKNMQIMAEIADDGAVTFREMPNVMQLDYIKRALGTLGSEGIDIFGRKTNAGARAADLAGDLKDAIADAVPGYASAVKLGGDKIAEDRALDLGRKMFSTATTREAVNEAMKGATITEKDAVRRGIREYIDDTLARVRRSIDDPSVDTKETLALLGRLTTRDARDKLEAVLGQNQVARLFDGLDAAGKHLATHQAIATGSATARRTARSQAVDAALAPGVIGNAAAGKPAMTVQSVVQLLTRETPQNALARRQEVLAEVATALTKTRGANVTTAIDLIEKAIDGAPLKAQEAALVSRVLAQTGALAAYQSGTKYLEKTQGAQ